MQVPANSTAATALVIGYFLLKISMIVTGAVMTHLDSNWWVLLIVAAFMF